MNNNILLVSAVFPPEPIVSASLSKDIACELSKKNKVTVICPNPSRPHGFNFVREQKVNDYKVTRLNSFTYSSSKIFGRLRESYSFGKHCQKYIATNHEKIDIIYANTWPLLAQYFIVSTAEKFNIPVIIHVQDIYPESLSNKLPIFSTFLNFILLPIDKYILNNATKVIAISNNMKNYLVKTRNIEKKKIIVVQNWQDENDFIEYKLLNKLDVISNKPFTFMYLGNIGPVAGVDLLLEAFSKADLKNSRLVIAGSGSMKEILKKNAFKLKLDAIEFWDVLDGKVPEIQNQADVMLLPIKKGAASSSIPSKLPAYMFSQKPIIVCVDEGSDTELAIKLSKCGWVLPAENIEGLAIKMKEVSKIPPIKLLEIGLNGFEYALKNLSKKNNLSILIKQITTNY